MKLKGWHAVALISCMVWLAYYPALSAPLNSVDDVRLAHDLLNRDGFGWHDFWVPRSRSYFRPLVNASFIVDQLLWGFEAPLLHLENLLIHWGNVLLVFALARRLALARQLPPLAVPAAAALLFGLHPLNTEAVIWVAGRADLLATTFVLLALGCALRHAISGAWGWAAAAGGMLLLGALAKETALFVLPGLFLVAWAARRTPLIAATPPLPWPRALAAVGFALAGVLAYALLRISALHGQDDGARHLAQVAFGSPAPAAAMPAAGADFSVMAGQLHTAVSGAGFYARKLVQPLPLNFGIVEVPSGYFWVGCLLLLWAAFLLWRLSWPGVFLLTAISLGAVALLVALGNVSWTPFAERYMYGPAAMLAIGGSLAGGKIGRVFDRNALRPWFAGGLTLLIVICSVTVYQRARIWQDNLTLFVDTVRKSPNFAMARNQLAEALWQRGQRAEALDIVDRTALPEEQAAFINQATVLIEAGRLADARDFLRDYLARPTTRGYHTAILERLVDVTDLLRRQETAPARRAVLDGEIVGYLEELWRRTQKPFYLYRIGQRQLACGDRAAARSSFALAAAKLPQESIYREPARQLAESLSEP